MRRFLAVSCLVLALPLAGSARADEMAAPASGPRAAVTAAMIDAREKILDLARAMPEAKYAWRPGKGVRSPCSEQRSSHALRIRSDGITSWHACIRVCRACVDSADIYRENGPAFRG